MISNIFCLEQEFKVLLQEKHSATASHFEPLLKQRNWQQKYPPAKLEEQPALWTTSAKGLEFEVIMKIKLPYQPWKKISDLLCFRSQNNSVPKTHIEGGWPLPANIGLDIMT